MNQQPTGHDIVVVGGSAGGVEALIALMRGLPPDLPATVLVVLHVGATSHLAEILNAAGPLPVAQAESGQLIEQGAVYVAGPDAHLLLHKDHLLLRRGPRENMSRPAIDPLFRSAAASFGGRVIGVILSGLLNDGAAGLRAIKRCGGLAVVQDPRDASFADMPRSALCYVDVDHVATSARMAGLLARLVNERAGPTPDIPLDIRLETAIAAQELTDMAVEEKLSSLSPFTCPECNGSLWEIEDGGLLRYRCHIGHGFTAEAVLSAQNEEINRIVEVFRRAQQERAHLSRRLALRAIDSNQHYLAAQLSVRAREYENGAQLALKLFEGAQGAGTNSTNESPPERERSSDEKPG